MEDFESELTEIGREGDLLEIPSLGLWTTFGNDGHPILTKEILEHSLLSSNYFPRLKARKTELPSLFSSEDFTPQVAAVLRNKDSLENSRKQSGFSSVRYTQTRHEGTSRVTHIPHPYAHCAVVEALMAGWEELKLLSLNTNSAIRPMVFRDGRVFASNYHALNIEEDNWDSVTEFGNTVRAFFDIKEFYPSISTHSLPQSALGRDFVQLNKKDPKVRAHFTEKLDEALRKSNRTETKGILIGPATSNLVAEYLLFPIDRALREKFGDRFRRHIDDFCFYGQSQQEVEEFRITLEENLFSLGLTLNPHKLRTEPISAPINPPWKTAISKVEPKELNSPEQIEKYWRLVIQQANQPNSGMALRYGMRVIINQARNLGQTSWSAGFLIRNLFLYPYLAPLLDEFIEDLDTLNQSDIDLLAQTLKSKFKVLYSDARSWMIFFLGLTGRVDEELASQIIASDDVVPMTILSWCRPDKSAEMASQLLAGSPSIYFQDEHWLLAYQLYLQGHGTKDSDGVFEKLSNQQVSFIDKRWQPISS